MQSQQKSDNSTQITKSISPLIFGTYSINNKIFFISSQLNKKQFLLGESTNIEDFHITKAKFTLRGFQTIHFSTFDMQTLAVLQLKKGGLRIAISEDLKKWQTLCQLKGPKYSSGAILSEFKHEGEYLMYLGGQTIRIATSQNGKKWKIDSQIQPIFPIKKNEHIEIDLAVKIPKGILLCYRLIYKHNDLFEHKVHLALFDLTFPDHLIWRSYLPIWDGQTKAEVSSNISTLFFRTQLIAFWSRADSGIELVHYPILGLNHEKPIVIPSEPKQNNYSSRSNTHTPLYYNNSSAEFSKKTAWQSYPSFDLTTLSVDKNINILYRTEQTEDPSHKIDFENLENPVLFILSKRGLWLRPILLSPKNFTDKNLIIFPEKINGKYIIMHNSYPNIAIDYENDLNFGGSNWLKEQDLISVRSDMWDCFNISAGAPPIKTAEGWLLIYNSFENHNSNSYKLGAMLLDLEHPAKVLYRSIQPIFKAETWLQNSSTYELNTAYHSGALILNQSIVIYYRDGSNSINIANSDLKSFLNALKYPKEENLQFSK